MMIINGASTVPPIDDEPRPGASKKFIGAAVVIAAVVVLGIVLSLTNVIRSGKDPTPAASAPSTSATASSSPSTTVVEASVCGLTALQMSGTLASAPESTWALVGTIAAPSVKGQGPGTVGQDGFRNCYARTPTGALLAAVNYVAVVSNAPTTRQAVSQLAADGQGRLYALDHLGKLQPVQSGLRMQVAGFQVVSYTGGLASVDLVFRTSAGALVSQVVDLVWEQGDWKVRYSDTGGFLSPAHTIDSLVGYIPWSGA